MKKFSKIILRIIFGIVIYLVCAIIFKIVTSYMPGYGIRLGLISFCIWVSGKILESKKATIICLAVLLLSVAVCYFLLRKPKYYDSVYYSSQYSEYHLDQHCPGLNGARQLFNTSSDYAYSKGYTPCPQCINSFFLFFQ